MSWADCNVPPKEQPKQESSTYTVYCCKKCSTNRVLFFKKLEKKKPSPKPTFEKPFILKSSL